MNFTTHFPRDKEDRIGEKKRNKFREKHFYESINLNWNKNRNDIAVSPRYACSILCRYEIRIRIIHEYLQILIDRHNADLIVNQVIRENDRLLTEQRWSIVP